MKKCCHRRDFKIQTRLHRRSVLMGGSSLALFAACSSSGPTTEVTVTTETAAGTSVTTTTETTTVVSRLDGSDIQIFNGIPNPNGWGESLVYDASTLTTDARVIGAYGGLPVVDIWTEDGGLAVFNTTPYHEPFEVKLERDGYGVTLTASGGSNIELYEHTGDYFEAVREFASRMKEKGLSVQSAPSWAFDANWETYGFEEDFDRTTVIEMLPTLKKLGIGTITIDSGWYGAGRGADIDFQTGDFPVNPDTVGTEEEWVEFIATLKAEGFNVRLWWVPGVTEDNTVLAKSHPDWLSDDVLSSTSDTGDIYLDPQNTDVVAWNKALVERLVGYGIDGFKQDDIYNYIGSSAAEQQSYADLINGNLEIAQALNKDFAINTCNCGLAQNFYMIAGQNQLITSDPVGSKQFRSRAKYLHALNVNGAAILGDHVELTQGDVGPDDMTQSGFYDTVDFTSIVPLGMVLQTKFRTDPGDHYAKWFELYTTYRFYEMDWVNVAKIAGRLESYLLTDDHASYYSFFTDTDNADYDGLVYFTELSAGETYTVFDIISQSTLGTFTATETEAAFNVAFTHSVTLQVTLA